MIKYFIILTVFAAFLAAISFRIDLAHGQGVHKSHLELIEMRKNRAIVQLYPTLDLEGAWGMGNLVHEGCEYIIFSVGERGGITHKGNCSNPIHGE